MSRTREELIQAIRKAAVELGRTPSQADMYRKFGVPWHQIYKEFGGMRAAIQACGLQLSNKGSKPSRKELVLDWAQVVRKLGALPNRREYDDLGKYSPGTLHNRLDWSQIAHRFVLMCQEFNLQEEWKDVLGVIYLRYPILRAAGTGDRTIGTSFESGDLVIGRPPHHANGARAGDPGGSGDRYPIEPTAGSPGAPEQNHERTALFKREDREDQWRFMPSVNDPNFTAECAEEIAGNANIGKESKLEINTLPLINADSTDWGSGRTTAHVARPVWMDKMKLGRLVAAEMAIQILMAIQKQSTQQSACEESTQQSAISIQPLLQCGVNASTLPQEAERQLVEECGPLTSWEDQLPGASKRLKLAATEGEYGAPIGLAGMAHAPVNEAGVLALFCMLATKLGFRIERVQMAYPDVEAKREIRPGIWKRVWIELEFMSRNFVYHKHLAAGCDIIVCWKHNWPECPAGIEVIELSRYV